MVEHYLDTVGVRGSNPLSRTILPNISREVMLFALVIAIIPGAVAAANAQVGMNFPREAKHLAVYAPPPEYRTKRALND